jgi:hypothetical protein
MPYTLDGKLVLYNGRPVLLLDGWDELKLAELRATLTRVAATMKLLRLR